MSLQHNYKPSVSRSLLTQLKFVEFKIVFDVHFVLCLWQLVSKQCLKIQDIKTLFWYIQTNFEYLSHKILRLSKTKIHSQVTQ